MFINVILINPHQRSYMAFLEVVGDVNIQLIWGYLVLYQKNHVESSDDYHHHIEFYPENL